MPLTAKQVEALPVIEWLISDEIRHRAVGRTEILCHAFVRKAIATGGWVRPFDHSRPWDFATHRHVNFPMRLKDIVEKEYPSFNFIWNNVNQEFRMEPK